MQAVSCSCRELPLLLPCYLPPTYTVFHRPGGGRTGPNRTLSTFSSTRRRQCVSCAYSRASSRTKAIRRTSCLSASVGVIPRLLRMLCAGMVFISAGQPTQSPVHETGTNFHDMREIDVIELNDPEGWIIIPLLDAEER